MGKPHYQTEGKRGHTFWSVIGTAIVTGTADALEGLGAGLEATGEVMGDFERNFPRTRGMLCAIDPVCLAEETMRMQEGGTYGYDQDGNRVYISPNEI